MSIRRAAEWTLLVVIVSLLTILALSLGWEKGFHEGIADCVWRFI